MDGHARSRLAYWLLLAALVLGFGAFVVATGIEVSRDPNFCRPACLPPDALTGVSFVGLIVGFVASFFLLRRD